jgi:tellurite resistance protein TerC
MSVLDQTEEGLAVDAALFADFLGKPVWMWLSFISIVLILLAFDLGVLHRKAHVIQVGESLLLSGF